MTTQELVEKIVKVDSNIKLFVRAMFQRRYFPTGSYLTNYVFRLDGPLVLLDQTHTEELDIPDKIRDGIIEGKETKELVDEFIEWMKK